MFVYIKTIADGRLFIIVTLVQFCATGIAQPILLWWIEHHVEHGPASFAGAPPGEPLKEFRIFDLNAYGVGNAFIHLDIAFVEGRGGELKQAIGRESLRLVKHYYARHLTETLQITVWIRDIERDFYFKHPAGSLD